MSEGETRRYYGKYRGTVINNIDPMQKGRIQVQVPDVTAMTPSSWAMPCFPFTGIQQGQWCLPGIGAGVWVEYEQGDADYPIWTGGFFGSGAEVPALALAATPGLSNVVIQTQLQNTLSISDMPGTGGILLKSMSGALIQINETGIKISNGQGAIISMTGPTVDVNLGALTIT